MLSEENKGYASTCQTIGLTVGQFLSFTIFLAFNSVEFRWALKTLIRLQNCQNNWHSLNNNKL